jgi:hypothetical protein
MKRIVLLSCVIAISSWAVPSVHAADSRVEGPSVIAPNEALDVIAAGAVEDTLKACFARIPADASVGQRMLAEQSCADEEGARQLIEGAPKF